jgi:hypothetical protein
LFRAIFLGVAEAVGVRSAARLGKSPNSSGLDIEFPTMAVKYSSRFLPRMCNYLKMQEFFNGTLRLKSESAAMPKLWSQGAPNA